MRPIPTFIVGSVCGAALALVIAGLASWPTGQEGLKSIVSSLRSGDASTRKSKPSAEDGSTAEQVARLMRWAAGKEPKMTYVERERALAAWAEESPLDALGRIKSARPFPDWQEAVRQPLFELAKRDPIAAADWLKTNLPPDPRTGRYPLDFGTPGRVFRALQDASPYAAFRFAEATDYAFDDQALIYALKNLARISPAKARLAYAKVSPDVQNAVAPDLAAALMETNDPTEIIAWCGQIKNSDASQQAYERAISTLLHINPPAAYVTLWERPQLRALTKDTLFRFLASSPQNLPRFLALALPAAKESAAEQAHAYARLALIVRKTDQRQSLAYLGQIPSSENYLMDSYFEAWLRETPGDAKATVAQSGNPEFQAALDRAQLRVLATTDSLAFLDKALSQPASIDLAEDVTLALDRLIKKDPRQAAAWLAGHPEYAETQNAKRVATALLAADEAMAADWLAQLPPSKAKDSALSVAVSHWARSQAYDLINPTIESVADPNRRVGLRVEAYFSIHAQNPKAADEWLATQPLGQEARQAIESYRMHIVDGE